MVLLYAPRESVRRGARRVLEDEGHEVVETESWPVLVDQLPDAEALVVAASDPGGGARRWPTF